MPHNLFSLHWPFEGSFAVAICMLVYCQTGGKIDRIYSVLSCQKVAINIKGISACCHPYLYIVVLIKYRLLSCKCVCRNPCLFVTSR